VCLHISNAVCHYKAPDKTKQSEAYTVKTGMIKTYAFGATKKPADCCIKKLFFCALIAKAAID